MKIPIVIILFLELKKIYLFLNRIQKNDHLQPSFLKLLVCVIDLHILSFFLVIKFYISHWVSIPYNCTYYENHGWVNGVNFFCYIWLLILCFY